MLNSELTWTHTYLTLYQMCRPYYKRKLFVMFPLWDAVTFKTGKLRMQNRSDILSVISVFMKN